MRIDELKEQIFTYYNKINFKGWENSYKERELQLVLGWIEMIKKIDV